METTKTTPAIEAILERTSVRKYSDEPVSDSQLNLLLRAAMAAPSGVNKQPWEFIVVRSDSVKKSLADALPYAKMAATAPVVIITCGNRARFLEGDDSTLWMQDLAAASENILVMARALGLGAVWTALEPHQDRMDTVSRILNLPEDFVPFNLIPVGHPAGTPIPRDKFNPDRVKYI